MRLIGSVFLRRVRLTRECSANRFFKIYTLSEGLPHPQAALKTFRISNTGAGDLSGSTAGAFIRREWVYVLDHRLEIYNWKTGERNGMSMVWRISAHLPQSRSIH